MTRHESHIHTHTHTHTHAQIHPQAHTLEIMLAEDSNNSENLYLDLFTLVGAKATLQVQSSRIKSTRFDRITYEA